LKVLITNDDGIDSEGLKVAESIALELAKKKEDIYVVAPSEEQSGSGHGLISYQRPVKLKKVSRNKYKLNGTPADCVLAGLTQVMGDEKPSLLISGVNKGRNVSEAVLYSGTVGGAMEGSLHMVKSIALSQSYSTNTLNSKYLYKWSIEQGSKICETLLKIPDWDQKAKNLFFNINFPSADALNGDQFKVCNIQHNQFNPFRLEKIGDAKSEFKTIYDSHQSNKSISPGDSTFLSNGFTTVTPINPDMTYYEMLMSIKEAVNDRKD